MAERYRFDESERRTAVDRARTLMTEHGYSANKAAEAVADDLGTSGRTVMRWADDLGLPLGDLSQDRAKEKLAAAHATVLAERDYNQAERLALLNEGFTKAREMLGTLITPQELQQWTVATGTLIDKRRLEEGKATERTENVDQRAAVERAKQRLTSIAGGKAS